MSSDDWIDAAVGRLAAPIANALVGGPFGSNLVSADYVLSGVPVIRGQNVGPGRWIEGDYAFVSDVKADALSSNIARAGDLVFTQRGTLGQVAIVPSAAHERYVVSQSQMKLTPDPNKADALFLYYVFIGPEQQHYIHQNAIQTGVPHTNLGILRDTPLRLPPIEEQLRIAGVLGALDDKIEHNRSLARSTVATARALLARHEGSTYRVGEIADVEKGLSYTGAGLDGQGIPMFNLANFSVGGWLNRAGLKFYSGDFRPRHIVRGNDLLVANTDLTQRREILGQPILVPESVDQALFTHHVFAVRFRPGFENLRYALYFALQSRAFRDRAETYASGTTVAALPRDALVDFEFFAPSSAELASLNVTALGLIRMAWRAEEEATSLVQIRDALLPRLVSGKIRVPEDYAPGDRNSAA